METGRKSVFDSFQGERAASLPLETRNQILYIIRRAMAPESRDAAITAIAAAAAALAAAEMEKRRPRKRPGGAGSTTGAPQGGVAEGDPRQMDGAMQMAWEQPAEERPGHEENAGALMEEEGATLEGGGATLGRGGATLGRGEATMEGGGATLGRGEATLEGGGATLEGGGATLEGGEATMEGGGATLGRGKTRRPYNCSTCKGPKKGCECGKRLQEFAKQESERGADGSGRSRAPSKASSGPLTSTPPCLIVF
jgi:hypothetical protein